MSVFISYSSKDELFANKIVEILEKKDIEFFLDKKNIKWGELPLQEISSGLMQCSIVLVVVSPASLKSGWVNFEIGQATALRKKLLPFLTDPNLPIPDYLKRFQYETDMEKVEAFFQDQLAANQKQEPSGKIEKELEKERHPLLFPEYVKDLRCSKMLSLKIPKSDSLYSSFEPFNNDKKLLRIKVLTTAGLIKNKKRENYVYIVRDPIRPFEIQIGESRASRPGGSPGTISLTGEMSIDQFKHMYPVMINDTNKWMRLVLAEIVQSSDILEYIYKNDPNEQVKNLVSKNSFAPDWIRQEGCLFCEEKEFLNPRRIDENSGANIIANDFPYGPFFHYIVIPKKPVHSWEDIDEKDLLSMNLLIKKFFLESIKGERAISGSVGVRVGLNSSIRHLVMGKTSRTSAGASIAHVHKQVWGMTLSSRNLADHLCRVCDLYDSLNVDYLGRYLKTLSEVELIIWQDKYVALYIPFGQTSIHELQIMIKRVGAYTYLDLEDEEICSLSKAEFLVTRIFKELKISSFNEIMLSRPFYSEIGKNFRLIVTFITREVDIAVSELSLIYVVDKHPFDTKAEVKKIWPKISKKYNLS